MRTRTLPLGTRNAVGKQIEELRKRRGIRQYEFVARLQVNGFDISSISYSKLEAQRRRATDLELIKIAAVLGVPVQALFPENLGSL